MSYKREEVDQYRLKWISVVLSVAFHIARKPRFQKKHVVNLVCTIALLGRRDLLLKFARKARREEVNSCGYNH
jgi:hypothetical protein